MMQEFQNLISNLGFPIFVACWMLFKQSKDTEKLTNILQNIQLLLTNGKGENDGK